MARAAKLSDAFTAAYPHTARWVREEEGWIEVGSDEFSASFVRAVYGGGLAWEGEPSYPTFDAAFRALDAGIAAWLDENRPADMAIARLTSKRPARAKKASRKDGIALTLVESSMLLAVGYDAATEELEAVFRSGAVWRYRGVPRKVYRDLLAAESKGSFMRSMVIDVYPDYQVRRR
ncbi:MAG: hypothetical protein JWO38_2422 [Gemmataceae bacterium]|nr:hypothetical protein [Gemmataceae bacterium]